MYLNELAIRVIAALLIQGRLRGAGADDRIRRLAEDRANASGRDDDRVGREGAHFHRTQIHRADAAADFLPVKHRREKLPVLVLFHFAFGLIPPNLLIERIKKLLPGSRPGERRSVVESPAKAAEVEQSFRRAIEGYAHTIEQIDDPGRRLAHVLDRRLIAEKVAAIDGVVKVLPGRIALALQILRRVDAALRANRMRTLDGND